MKRRSHPVLEMKETLKRLETEATQLKSLCEGIPSIEKNLNPILAFIDILKFHIDDLSASSEERVED